MKVTGEQIKEAMIAANIIIVSHHDCAICGEYTFYIRQENKLFYDSSCGCGISTPSYRLWDDAAEWINMQSEEVARKLAAKFGLNI